MQKAEAISDTLIKAHQHPIVGARSLVSRASSFVAVSTEVFQTSGGDNGSMACKSSRSSETAGEANSLPDRRFIVS
jgi:hypothetical protein